MMMWQMIGFPLKTVNLLRFSCAAAIAVAVVASCAGCGHFSRGSDYDDAYTGGLDSLLEGMMLPPASASNAGGSEQVGTRTSVIALDAGETSAAEGETVGASAAEGEAVDASAAEGEAVGAFAADGDGFDPLPSAEYIPEGVIPKLGEDGEPLLRTGLTISVHVTVADKTEVPTQVRLISPENTVMLPFVGVVSCDGMTLRKFREHLTRLYGDYLHDPVVSAEFVTTGDAESPWGKVRVMGHVGREGWINIPATRDLSLLSALQRAGGVSKGAKRGSVRITRNMPDGTKKVFRADLDKLGKEGDEEQDIPLEPGDTVWVDERVW